MKKPITFEIDEEVADKAERIYNALGMDTQMALTMFMRRTVAEGALPMSSKPNINVMGNFDHVVERACGHPDERESTPEGASTSDEPESEIESESAPASYERGGESSDESSSVDDSLAEDEPDITENNDDHNSETTAKTSNSITQEMVDGLWDEFLKTRNSDEGAKSFSERVADETGMSQGSAFIYINVLKNLVGGNKNSRNIKMHDLKYLMGRIREELGEEAYSNACKSLEDSLEEWSKKKYGRYAQKVREFLDEQNS